MIRFSKSLACCSTALALSLSAPAFATAPQATAAPDGSEPAQAAAPDTGQDAAAQQSQEVVVTATKRSQSVQDVPISMDVLSGSKLSDFRATDMKAIMNYTPNVFVQQTAGNDVIYIRGFGSPPANFTFDQAVGVYVDGIYNGRIRQALNPFFDVQRVEVLRGPQGALFGKNTAAGAISIVSANPTAAMSAALNATYNFDQKGYDLDGYVSGPVSDTLGARFAFRLQDQDGYMKNVALGGRKEPNIQNQMFRFTVKWAPSADFDLTSRAQYENYVRVGAFNTSSPINTEQRPRLIRGSVDAPFLAPEGNINRSWIASSTANWRFGDGWTLTGIVGYSAYTGSVTNYFDQLTPALQMTRNSAWNRYEERFGQFSQEVRLLSPTGKPFEFIVGGYHDRHFLDLDQIAGFDVPSGYFGLLHTIFRQTGDTISVFGQGTAKLTDSFRAVGSLRYTKSTKDGDYYGRVEAGPTPGLRPTNTTANDSFSEDHIDPSLTLQYDVTRDIMLYGTFGNGSKSGGFVGNGYGTTNANFRFAAERSRNYEIGFKAALFDRKVLLDMSLYNTQFKDLQVSSYNSVLAQTQTGNAASATSKGVEAILTLRPTSTFDITASGAYMDIKYDDYPGAPCLASQPVAQCDPLVPASVAANNLAGFRPPYTSKWTGSVTAHYRLNLTDYKFDLTGIAAGRSGFFDADNQHPDYGYQHGFVKIDARIQFAPQNDRWHIAVVGKNLTDKLTTGSAFGFPGSLTTVPRAILVVEPPRSIAVEAGVKF